MSASLPPAPAGVVLTRMLRTRPAEDGNGVHLVEHFVRDLVASEATWATNARRLAAEAAAEKLFPGEIHWALVSQLCRHLLKPPPPTAGDAGGAAI